MVKLAGKPSFSASRRRMRTQAEWKVQAQMSFAPSPSIRSSRSFSSPAALLVKGDGKDAPGRHRVQRRDALCLRSAFAEYGQLFLVRVGGKLVAVPGLAVFQKIGNAVDEYRGFSAARARQNQQRALRGHHCLNLLVIQMFKIGADHIAARLKVILFKFSHHSDNFSTKPPDRQGVN